MAKNKKVSELMSAVEAEASLFLTDDSESDSFIPEVIEDETLEAASENDVSDGESDVAEDEVIMAADVEGTELDAFESAQIEELIFIADEHLESIVESILFASDRPVSLASIQMVFKGTNIKKDKIRRAIENLAVEYAGGRRGVVLEEVTGGYQVRTKVDNMNFLKGTVKTRAFKLSGPALETLAIVAYKQPVIKLEIDQIRGVESGHLLRALMEKGLVNFEGKAETLPGKPMQYGTTRRFLEIFGLRNLKELPTLSQIDELLPEGIGEDEEADKPTLSMVTDSMSEDVRTVSYSQGEDELGQIEQQLTSISTSSEFFEQEKNRQKQKRDEEKAQNIREALAVGEAVPKRDQNWLKKFEEGLTMASLTIVENNEDSMQASAAVLEKLDDATEEDSDDEAPHIEDEIPFYDEEDEEESTDGQL
ncbi:MAG: SMC-Scp complex subunit ScpB [Bdellovibrionaceae bacterium]|nr:SMC-Scp complex subunit ScpB [Bdellovibrio sp.]